MQDRDRGLLAVMSELGPRHRAERLPGEAYWKDLPDRVLARIAQPRTGVRPGGSGAFPSL